MPVQNSEAVASAASSAVAAVAKVAPPLAISGISISGLIPLNDLVLLVTLVYTLAQFYFLIRDRMKKRRALRAVRR